MTEDLKPPVLPAQEASLPPPFPETEFRSRRQALASLMGGAGIDVGIVLAPADLIYFTGYDLASQLVVGAGGDSVHLVQINLERVRSGSPVGEVRRSLGVRSVLETVDEMSPPGGSVGLPLDVLPQRQFAAMAERLAGRRLQDLSPLVLRLRRRKSPAELEVLRQAASISAAAFARAREIIRPGLAEFELQLQMEAVEHELGADGAMRSRGWRGFLPWGIVCSGPGTAEVSGHWLTQTGFGPSAARPYSAGRRRLQSGDPVVIDRGLVLHGYHCDEARTMVVGEANDRQLEYWAALGRILAAAIAAVRPGATAAAAYQAAANAAAAEGLLDFFMTRATGGLEYLGHGVGLEIDEPPLVGPRSNEVLEPGMVLALEPKIIVPGWGGMTLEETVAVTEAGHEVITRSSINPLEVAAR